MTSANPALAGGIPDRKLAVQRAKPAANVHGQRMSGAFLLGLALYIILTGDFPNVIQALAFGMKGSGGTEFAVAMMASAARDLLLLLPLLMLSRHPLGILHPLVLAVVLWPLIRTAPKVIEEYGGWAGILAGLPVETPYYAGLRSYDPTVVWSATAKYNAILAISLLSTYFGFWVIRPKPMLVRRPTRMHDLVGLRNLLLGLFGISMAVLVIYLFYRGGLVQHLTSLGNGRFRELAGLGPILVLINLATISLYLWIAARPGDIKAPAFLACLAAASLSQFLSDGSRGSAILVPITVGLIWSIRRQQIPWKIALALVPFMFVSLGLLAAVRTSSWSGSTADQAFSETSWSESLKLAQEEIEERQVASANVPVIARGFEVTGGPLLGSSYIAAAVAVVPRALWQEKPRGTGALYSRLFLHAPEEGAAIPVTPEAEAYWNFGMLGVISFAMLYGILLRVIYNVLWKRFPDPFFIVLFILFITSFQFSTRALVGAQQQLGLLFICYVAAAVMVSKRPRARGLLLGRFGPTLRSRTPEPVADHQTAARGPIDDR